MSSRSLGHRAPLLWLVLPFMGGLIAGSAGVPSGPIGVQLAVALLAAGTALWAASTNRRGWAPALLVALFCGGSSSYRLDRARIAVWDDLPPREVRLSLEIHRIFPQRDARNALGLATIHQTEAHLRELRGQRVYFSLAQPRGAQPPIRSSVVSAVGVLVTLPRNPPANSFDAYLAAAGMNFRLTRGRIVGEVRPPSAYRQFCQRGLTRFTHILSTGVAAKRPELTAVLRAMLLGQKHELSDEQDELFMRSGTMHLFAISGLHIGMIAVALHALLSLLRLPPLVRFGLELIALWLYVEITGGAPSAVRAFFMVALLEASLVLRTPRNPLAALATSALIVLLVRPMQLFSASFQLSYAIVAALLLFGLPLGDAWQERWPLFRDLPRPAWRWFHRFLAAAQRKLVSAVAIGLASTLVSTLGGVLFFQLFTPGALVANLALIPAAMLVILGGFASLVAGLLGAESLSALFNHSAVLVLWLIDGAVRALLTVPGTWHVAQFSRPWVGPAALLILLAVLLAGYQAAWRRAAGGWWAPFIVVGATLCLGTTFG